mmetsp:Transcript_273/g.372  ORF Transcript_273/g.372 Transcript_273/m.372 type:complete len:509 (+) Transcript_273:50-1576(+)
MTGIRTLCFLVAWFTENAIVTCFQSQQRQPHSSTTRLLSSNNDLFPAEKSSAGPKPIDPSGWPMKFPAKEHCSKCGLCETTFVEHVKEACAFLDDGMSKIDILEPLVHNGRSRKNNDVDEQRFGILHQPVQLVRGKNMEGAQWTGAVTSIALSMLETQQVDAVVCVAGKGENDDDWSVPQPIIARNVEDVLRGRGVKPSLSPNLNLLDQIQEDPTIKRLLFCGVGCAVQAFRAVQGKLKHVEEVYVLGTNCADNAPTPEAASNFIQSGMKISPEKAVKGYEFMQDYRVHVKLEDPSSGESEYVTKPYFSLPASVADPSIAYSCRACFDYTNGLADVVIGYMGAPIVPGMRMDDPQSSQQTLTVRNERGSKMVQTAVEQNRLWINPEPPLDKGKHELTAINTVWSDTLVMGLYQENLDLPTGMPEWAGNILASVLQQVGPKGLAFARYSIDYHVLRNFFHVLHQCKGDQLETFKKLPESSRQLVQGYLGSSKQIKELKEKIQDQFKHKI